MSDKQGWNRPHGGNAANGDSKPRSRLRIGLVTVVTALAVAAGLYFALRQPEDAREEIEKKPRSQIETAVPAVAKPAPADTAPENKPGKWPEKSPHPDGKWRHGEGPRSIAVTNGCLVTYPHCPGVQLVLPHPAFAAPFDNISNNEIARILTAKPGDDFIDAPLPANFDEQFAKSLLSPIEISEDDTAEKAELKSQIKEARKALAEAVKRGESPRQILAEEAKTLRRLMQTRDNYQRIVNEQIQSGASDQDINDTVNAANRMLQNEGIDARVILPYKTNLRIKRGKLEGSIKD